MAKRKNTSNKINNYFDQISEYLNGRIRHRERIIEVAEQQIQDRLEKIDRASLEIATFSNELEETELFRRIALVESELETVE